MTMDLDRPPDTAPAFALYM